MVDKTTGHIRNQLRSEDAESMARIGLVHFSTFSQFAYVWLKIEPFQAEQNATELTELRNKLYFAYLFINILWMVISLAVKQANIKIALPQEISNQLPSQCYDEPLPANVTDSVDREPFEMEPLRSLPKYLQSSYEFELQKFSKGLNLEVFTNRIWKLTKVYFSWFFISSWCQFNSSPCYGIDWVLFSIILHISIFRTCGD